MLTAHADHTRLKEGATYDVATVRIRMTDQNGSAMPYYFGAVKAEVKGDGIELIGEDPIILRAGMGGVYVRTTGKSGQSSLTLSADGCESVTINFDTE